MSGGAPRLPNVLSALLIFLVACISALIATAVEWFMHRNFSLIGSRVCIGAIAILLTAHFVFQRFDGHGHFLVCAYLLCGHAITICLALFLAQGTSFDWRYFAVAWSFLAMLHLGAAFIWRWQDLTLSELGINSVSSDGEFSGSQDHFVNNLTSHTLGRLRQQGIAYLVITAVAMVGTVPAAVLSYNGDQTLHLVFKSAFFACIVSESVILAIVMKILANGPPSNISKILGYTYEPVHWADRAVASTQVKEILLFNAIHNVTVLACSLGIVSELIGWKNSWHVMFLSLVCGAFFFGQLPFALGQWKLHKEILATSKLAERRLRQKELEESFAPYFPKATPIASLLTSGSGAVIVYLIFKLLESLRP